MAESFLGELKRRNVFRVAAIYLVVGWLLMQVGDVMFPALRLPDWTSTLLAAFFILGLPLALIFAWAFELTPDGVVRTAEVPAEQSITADTGRRINFMIIGVLVIAVAFLLIKDFLRPDATPVAGIASPDRSIAVLPFKNQSASTENAEFFAGGLHDELLTLLSKLGELKVISRTSVERLDPDLTIQEIGALLGVATVLEGQVQRAGDRLRINVQLIDTMQTSLRPLPTRCALSCPRRKRNCLPPCQRRARRRWRNTSWACRFPSARVSMRLKRQSNISAKRRSSIRAMSKRGRRWLSTIPRHIAPVR